MATRSTRQKAPESSTTLVVPSGAPSWVTPELLGHTLRVWQRFSETPLSIEDAMEILTGTSLLIESLIHESHTRGRHGADSSGSSD